MSEPEEFREPDVTSDGVSLQCPRCEEYVPVTVNWFIDWDEEGVVTAVECKPDSSMIWVHEWACQEPKG